MRHTTVTLRTICISVLAPVQTYRPHGRCMAAQTVGIHDIPPVIGDLDVYGIVIEHLMERVVHTCFALFKIVNGNIVVRQMALHAGDVRM